MLTRQGCMQDFIILSFLVYSQLICLKSKEYKKKIRGQNSGKNTISKKMKKCNQWDLRTHHLWKKEPCATSSSRDISDKNQRKYKDKLKGNNSAEIDFFKNFFTNLF